MTIPRMMLIAGALSGCLAATAWSQDTQTEIQRNLLERQQREQEFRLRQQQFEESLNPRLSGEQKQQLESRQQGQRQRQQELHQRQIQQFDQIRQNVKPESPDQPLKLELQLRQFQREQEQQSQQFRRERQDTQPGN